MKFKSQKVSEKEKQEIVSELKNAIAPIATKHNVTLVFNHITIKKGKQNEKTAIV